MSEAAVIGRDRRLRWARPGSGHDRGVRLARVVLPSAVGALAAVLAITPLAKRAEVSFVLAKDKVQMARERMRVERAVYRGQDDKGQPFELNAGSAVQASSKTPLVRLGALSARMALQDGPATLSAPRASYDMDAERLMVDGPLMVERSDGYRLTTSNVGADLKTRMVSSDAHVDGQLPIGTFSAGSMRADIGTRVVTLGGRARLRITQSRAKGR